MTVVRSLPLPSPLLEPPPGTLRITLSNSSQGRHLQTALHGHCEAELVAGSEGTAVAVRIGETGSRNVLRRVDAWLSEFGVASAALELNGQMYDMTKS